MGKNKKISDDGTVYTEVRKKFSLAVMIDEDATDPRDHWDNLTTILYKNGNQYQLGDQEASDDDILDIKSNPEYIVRDVYIHEHGNISLRTKPFNDRFDSGCSGIIYIERERLKNENLSEKDVDGIFNSELKTLEQYCNGEVYFYNVLDKYGEVVDSIFCIYGLENCKNAARESLSNFCKAERNIGNKFEDVSLSDIVVSSFSSSEVIGTKIWKRDGFLRAVNEACNYHEFSDLGQSVIELKGVERFVSCGIGKAVDNESAYIVRSHRGKVSSYLRREFAAEKFTVSVVVYTKAAYLKDPDCSPEEIARITAEDPKYVLVAVLSSPVGYRPQMSPYRFVKNLAGGNNNELSMSADEIRACARNIINADDWDVVADGV